jgi:large subunit ribosomal protein L19e
MTDLKSQRRLAAQVLKIGQNRVWIDPERADDVEAAITRDEVRRLIHQGTIKASPERGISRGRVRIIHEKKKKGRRSGPGSRTGSSHARVSKKQVWMRKIRALRNKLRTLKAKKMIVENSYQRLYRMAGSGRFESVADLERYMKAHELWRKR